MNHLACGGYLLNSCRATYKTTPVNVGIKFLITKYPKPEKDSLPPPIQVPHEQSKLLYTSNLRSASGYGKRNGVYDCTIY